MNEMKVQFVMKVPSTWTEDDARGWMEELMENVIRQRFNFFHRNKLELEPEGPIDATEFQISAL